MIHLDGHKSSCNVWHAPIHIQSFKHTGWTLWHDDQQHRKEVKHYESLWSTRQRVKELILSSTKRPVNQLQCKKRIYTAPRIFDFGASKLSMAQNMTHFAGPKLFGSFYQSSQMCVFPPMDIDQPPALAWLPRTEDKHGQDLCWAARKHENQPSWIIESWHFNSYKELIVPHMFYTWSYDLVYTTWWFRQLSISNHSVRSIVH